MSANGDSGDITAPSIFVTNATVPPDTPVTARCIVKCAGFAIARVRAKCARREGRVRRGPAVEAPPGWAGYVFCFVLPWDHACCVWHWQAKRINNSFVVLNATGECTLLFRRAPSLPPESVRFSHRRQTRARRTSRHESMVRLLSQRE